MGGSQIFGKTEILTVYALSAQYKRLVILVIDGEQHSSLVNHMIHFLISLVSLIFSPQGHN